LTLTSEREKQQNANGSHETDLPYINYSICSFNSEIGVISLLDLPYLCVLWFNPSRQLSTTQPLAHTPPVMEQGREQEG